MADSLGKVEVTPVSPTVVSIDPQDQSIVSVVESNALVTLSTPGPKETIGKLSSLNDVDVSEKVDSSVLYYDGGSDTFKADDLNTIITITDGGNF